MKTTRSHRVEPLEQRIAPATIVNPLSIGGTTQATFTDSDGDIVTVRIAGTAGSVDFFDAGAGPVNDGDDIATVNITGASANFTLTYSVDNGANAKIVQMGNITSDKVLFGIFSVPDSTGGSIFNLTSFKGVNFSAGGGLAVDDIVGDAADLGLELSGGLHKDATLLIRRTVDGDLVLGNGGDLIDGTMIVGGAGTAGSDLTVNGNTGINFSWVGNSSFAGAATFNGTFKGSVDIDGSTNGAWKFNKGVEAAATLHSDDWQNVAVTGAFAGLISSESSHVVMNVSGDLKSTAKIQSSGAYTLTIGGNVLAGATAVSDDGSSFTVGGNMSGTFIAGSSSFVGTVGKDVKGATIVGSFDASVTVGGSVINSTIEGDNELFLDITGSVSNSDLSSGHSDSIITIDGSVKNSRFSGETTATIGGSVSGSQFVSGGDGNAPSDSDISLTVAGSVIKTTVTGGNVVFLDITGGVANSNIGSHGSAETLLTIDGDVKSSQFHGDTTATIGGSVASSRFRASEFDNVSLTVGGIGAGHVTNTVIEADQSIRLNATGSISKSRFISTTGSVSLTTGGDLLKTTAIASDDDIILSITGNALDNTFLTDDDSQTWTIGGNFKGVFATGSGDLTMTVGGSVLKGSQFMEGDDLVFAVTKDFEAIVVADQLDLKVGGNVKSGTRITVNDVRDSGDADTIGFSVGGDFAGILNTRLFDPNSDAANGQTHVIVGGNVTKAALFNIIDIAGTSAGDTYSFTGDFQGRLAIGGNLDVDLTFLKAVRSIVIGGSVVGLDTINIAGKLASLIVGGSLFDETTPGTAGNFVDENGVITGNLIATGGYTTVLPLDT